MVRHSLSISVKTPIRKTPAVLELVFFSWGAGYLKRKEKEKEEKKEKKKGEKREKELETVSSILRIQKC